MRTSFIGSEFPMKIAAFTMTYNEPIFLPIWIAYYGREFGEENLFIIDHGSDDGSTEDIGNAHRIVISRDELDEGRRAKYVILFHEALLQEYDAVVFSDTDEYLIADPRKFGSLKEFIQERCTSFSQAIGLEVLHILDKEARIDVSRPILAQRSFVRFNTLYCKPLITRVPLIWGAGFHSCDLPSTIDPDLFLFHLKRMDRDIALARLAQTRSISWSKNARKRKHSYQNRFSDDVMLQELSPFRADNVGALLIDGFDFTSDCARYPKFAPFEGAIAAIPEAFRDAIPGV